MWDNVGAGAVGALTQPGADGADLKPGCKKSKNRRRIGPFPLWLILRKGAQRLLTPRAGLWKHAHTPRITNGSRARTLSGILPGEVDRGSLHPALGLARPRVLDSIVRGWRRRRGRR